MTKRRRAIVNRDQRASAFSAALLRLCESVGAIGAALVDAEGETVDYAGSMDPFDIKVAAAEWVVLLALLKESKVPRWSDTQTVFIRGAKKSFFVQLIADGYSVVMQLLPYAFAVSKRGMDEAVRELCTEAGLTLPPLLEKERERWRRVDVRCEPRRSRRPSAVWIGNGWSPVEVLGRWTSDLGPREVGYRARLQSGEELTLVRERLGRWYSDARLAP
jgi:hypothetical protein